MSERAHHINKPVIVLQHLIADHEPQKELDTKTDRLNDRLSQSDFDLSQSLYWQPAFTLVCCSVYFSTMKMEAICSSETSIDFQQTI
jgi:hypothetical protein